MADEDDAQRQLRSKRAFYGQEKVARQYDRSVYRSPKGEFVFGEERSILNEVIPRGRGGHVLDVPSGGGRFLALLRDRGYTPVAADISRAMLSFGPSTAGRMVCAEAARLPFPSGCFAGVLSHRFIYHYAAIESYLTEFHRVLRPGGWLCFDVIRWAPSSIGRSLGIDSPRFVHVHPLRELVRAVETAGFSVEARQDAFPFNPAWASYLGLRLVRALLRADALGFVPRAKSYFLLRKMGTEADR